MRIMLVTQDIPPYCRTVGNIQRVLFYCDYLNKRGHNVCLVGVYQKNYDTVKTGWYDEILKNIKVHALNPGSLVLYWEQLKKRFMGSGSSNGNIIDKNGRATSYFKKIVINLYNFFYQKIVLDYNGIFQIPKFKKEIANIILNYEPDVLIVSVPPHYMLRMVPWIRSRFKNIKITIDFRDGFTSRHIFRAKSNFRLWLQLYLEKKVLSSVDGIVFATPGMKDYYMRNYIKIINKSCVIYNGYVNSLWPEDLKIKSSKLIIKYIGSGEFRPDSLTTPNKLFKVIEDCLSNKLFSHNDIGFSFIGKINEFGQLDNYPMVKEIVCLKGQVSPETSHIEMLKADILLVIYNYIISSEEVLTGKLFDYLRARRPILYLTSHNCGIKKFLDQLGIGIWLDIEDKEQIKSQIIKLVNIYKSGKWDEFTKSQILDEDTLNFYSRESQYKIYEEFLQSLCNEVALND